MISSDITLALLMPQKKHCFFKSGRITNLVYAVSYKEFLTESNLIHYANFASQRGVYPTT